MSINNVTDTLKTGMHPPHPGAFIRSEILEELDLSVSKASEILDVRRATLSDLLNEKTSLSPEMALRIELAFDIKADMLLKIQAWHDSITVREKADDLKVQRYAPTD